MNIKVSLKNVMIACIFFAGLAISSTSFGQFTYIKKIQADAALINGASVNYFIGTQNSRFEKKLDVADLHTPKIIATDGIFNNLNVTGDISGKILTAQGGTFQGLTTNYLGVNNDLNVTGNISGKLLTAQGGTFQGLTTNYLIVNNDLNVIGNISAKRISLAVGSFPDYVFAKDYDLMPLEQIEAYIKANHHLPKVPTATQVIKEGMDVAQINVLLMEKVEELTLHLIAQNKQIKKLMQEVKTLKAQK